MVVTEVVPGIAVIAVVFAHGSALLLAEIRAPLLPRNALLTGIVQTFLLGNFNIREGRMLLFGDIALSFTSAARCWRKKICYQIVPQIGIENIVERPG